MLTLIATVDPGNNINVPWLSPTNLSFFLSETIGGTLIMSASQYGEYEKRIDLSGWNVLIIDHGMKRSPGGEPVFQHVTEALKHCWKMQYSRIYVLGDRNLYHAAIKKAERIIMGTSKESAKTDNGHFPNLNSQDWNRSQLWLPDCEVVPIVKEYTRIH